MFAIAQLMEDFIFNLQLDEHPQMIGYLSEFTSLYYNFGDYDRTEQLCRFIMSRPLLADTHNALCPAYNHLGLVYSTLGEYVRSDSMFTAIINRKDIIPNPSYSSLWNAVARGNLGDNALAIGEYRKAIELQLLSLDSILLFNDYRFACGRAITIADAYLHLGDTKKAERYLRRAIELNDSIPSLENARMDEIYPVMASYFAMTGDGEKAILYADSANKAREMHAREYDILKLKRFEQERMHNKLLSEQEQSARSKLLAAFLSVWGLSVSILLLFVFRLLKKNTIAYRAIVRTINEKLKRQDIAKEKVAEDNKSLMERLQQVFDMTDICLKKDITIDEVAIMLNVHPRKLSQAINITTGGNFTAYVNRWRVNKALHIMADEYQFNNMTQLALTVGFANRISFFRAFKREIGLSPTDYINVRVEN
jgi:AraC-like DNA-binding protein